MSGTDPRNPSKAGSPPPGRADFVGGRERREFISLMTARVRDAPLRKPFFAEGGTDLVTLCRDLKAHGRTGALVRDGERLGIFTTTDLRDALALGRPPETVAVREVAIFEPLSVSADDELFEALIVMLRHGFHRVIVREKGEITGVLTQLDLMAYVANHSQLIALEAAQADTIAELGAAARQIDGMIRLLSEDGVRVEIIAGLVGGLNRRIFERLWTLVAPETLRANSCLVVMGSEGRGEQIIKTDQDNALILRDGFAFDGLEAVTETFTAALIDFGYPPCPGGIMVNRPLWRQPVGGFRAALRDWTHGSAPEGPMNLAIFLDAAAVAGDAALLDELETYLRGLLAGSDAFFARFAAAIEQFGGGGGWWRRLPGLSGREAAEIDLKKLGIFPLVHGVRTLALQYGVTGLGTAERIAALSAAGRIDAPLARDLVDALHLLMGLKLGNNLRQLDAGRAPDNAVRLSELGTLDREALREALAIVRRFKDWLRSHYRLDAL
ncbi:putative nucleotidyltransferase substrate binding domain-containing protein [Amaricoccus solimangrovi]|uniref:CBS domain-containing protein n=1 Tax=Amaricoccus solimangrovi TaxID=2589815 RepID=A0A501WER9_9RHOB|nr:putative nucleotidyltransferase substrate binding domain-containing protein [Amaricoccus solimangrovi]TPE46840.1 CBS domain-containing protein [Amaricoccus solimangrovi]